VLEVQRFIGWRMHDQMGDCNPLDSLLQIEVSQAIKHLLFDDMSSASNRNGTAAVRNDFWILAAKEFCEVPCARGRSKGCERSAGWNRLDRGHHRRTAKRMSNQQRGSLVVFCQPLARGVNIRKVGFNIGISKVSLAIAKSREIESEHAYIALGESSTYSHDRF